MNGLWKKRVPAFFLTLVIIVSLMPAALADNPPACNNLHVIPENEGDTPSPTLTSVVTVEPTCGKPGVREWSCTACSNVHATREIPPTKAHTYPDNGAWKEDSEDSKDIKAQHVRICSVCGEKDYQDHLFSSWGTPEKDTFGQWVSYHKKVCSECHYTLVQDHEPRDSGKRTVSCTTSGGTTYVCQDCGVEYLKIETLRSHVDSNGDNICDRCTMPIVTGNTIKFETNGSSNNSAAALTQTVPTGSTLSVPIRDPQKGTGYTFKGWQEGSSSNYLFTGQSTLKTSADLNPPNPFHSSATFYAIYQVAITGQTGFVGAASNIGTSLWDHIKDKCTTYLGGAPASVTFSSLGSSTTGALYLDSTQTSSTAVQTGIAYSEASFRNMTYQPGSSTAPYRLYYTAKDQSGYNSVEGYVDISRAAANTITVSVAPGGKDAYFDPAQFQSAYRAAGFTDTLSYVTFPNVASGFSTFSAKVYNGPTELNASTLAGGKYYYSTGGISALLLRAPSDAKDGSFSTAYRVYSSTGAYAEGTLELKVSSTASSDITPNYIGSIRYSTTGTNVQINANDIARYFRKSYPTDNLQYVTLGGVPATGDLYYNYYNASSYGTAARTQITAASYAGMTLYLSPASTAQYALTELTYVPSGTSYCAGIPFTAYGTGGSVSGSILISVSRAAVAEVYGVTPRNTAVTFPASSIHSAVLTATGTALSGIQLLELPSAIAGAVYIGSGNDRADTRTMYTSAAGSNQMALLRFVPTAAYTGSVEIPYVALDANGSALATGTFALGVLNDRKTLTDVNSSTWCYKYVMELTDQNVISGYTDGSFKPNTTVTYGAALKLIMLAAGYPEQSPTGENVFSGYLSKAQADGIITRSNVDLTAPITRLQVAQLAAGALKLSTSNLSSVKPFTDTSDVYVQALNAAGIVEGYFSNGTSAYRPSNTLTRGQMSAIVWRMLQYRK